MVQAGKDFAAWEETVDVSRREALRLGIVSWQDEHRGPVRIPMRWLGNLPSRFHEQAMRNRDAHLSMGFALDDYPDTVPDAQNGT